MLFVVLQWFRTKNHQVGEGNVDTVRQNAWINQPAC